MTPTTRPTNRTRRTRTHRPRASEALVSGLIHRLTDRDKAILDLVWEHRVLTTEQLTAIFFPSAGRARQRLLELYHLAALERFQPWTPIGTRPHHWVLGPAGAHVIAAQRGLEVTDLGYRLAQLQTILMSSKLGHQVGVNDFFIRLLAHARTRTDGTTLAEWWPERRCARLWGDLAHPDAFGRWSETQDSGPPAELDFFLEHDTGTVPPDRVVAKLAGYAALAESTGITTPVLFWLPTSKREATLRKLLKGASIEVPVATAVQTPITSVDGPAGAVWLPAGTTGPRQRLAALAQIWSGNGPRSGET